MIYENVQELNHFITRAKAIEVERIVVNSLYYYMVYGLVLMPSKILRHKILRIQKISH